MLAAGMALLTGYLEAGFLVSRNVLFRTITGSDPDALWMAPIAYLFFHLLIVLLLEPLVRLGRGWWTLGRYFAPFVFIDVGFLLLAIFKLRLHGAAIILLALGAAVQTVRWVERRGNMPLPILLRVSGGLALSWIPLVLLTVIGPVLSERWALSRRQTAGRHPNVLLIILDTVRAQNLGLYGYRYPTTPELDHWAKTGVVFDFAVAPSSWTLPSHAAIFTGRSHRDLNVDWFTGLDDRWPTLAERFQAMGYRTGGFVANWVYTTRQSGLGRGFDHYDDMQRSMRQGLLYSMPGQLIVALRGKRFNLRLFNGYRQAARRWAPEITDRFLAWSNRDAERPFFAFLNYFDAHAPYKPLPTSLRFGPPKAGETQYNILIHQLDKDLGRLLTELDRRGLLSNTLVMITADHGELFGEHGLSGHGNSLYLPLIHVPLMVLWPGVVPADVRVSSPVGLVDLPTTIAALVQMEASDLPGRPLQSCWVASGCGFRTADTLAAAVRGNPDAGPGDPVIRGPMVSLISGGLQYIRNGDGSEELYDIARDSSETNLATDSAWASAVAHFRQSAVATTLPERPGLRKTALAKTR
jgi:arylsulfatase A-like enzyme